MIWRSSGRISHTLGSTNRHGRGLILDHFTVFSQVRDGSLHRYHSDEEGLVVRAEEQLPDIRHLPVRAETGQVAPFLPTSLLGRLPRHAHIIPHGNARRNRLLQSLEAAHIVAPSAHTQTSPAAPWTGVGTLLLVLPPRAVRLQVAGEVVPEVRPVGHGAVPRAVGEPEGAGWTRVEGELEPEPRNSLITSKGWKTHVENPRVKVVGLWTGNSVSAQNPQLPWEIVAVVKADISIGFTTVESAGNVHVKHADHDYVTNWNKKFDRSVHGQKIWRHTVPTRSWYCTYN